MILPCTGPNNSIEEVADLLQVTKKPLDIKQRPTVDNYVMTSNSCHHHLSILLDSRQGPSLDVQMSRDTFLQRS